jgi:hypothetical protein
MVPAARVLAEFGDDRHRYATAKARKADAAPPRSPDPQVCGRWYLLRRSAIGG